SGTRRQRVEPGPERRLGTHRPAVAAGHQRPVARDQQPALADQGARQDRRRAFREGTGADRDRPAEACLDRRLARHPEKAIARGPFRETEREAGVFGCILNRMIFWELVKVFVLCLIAITGILLMAGIVAEASQQGLNPAQILAIIPLLIPSTLPYTIPATTLFATCVVYGRLSADNEVLAIRASGINLTKIVGPAVLIGLLTSAATMGLYYRAIP